MQVFLGVLGEEAVPAGQAPGVTLAPALPDREVVASAIGAGAGERGAGVQRARRPCVKAYGCDVDLDPLGPGRLLELDGLAQPVAEAAIPLSAAGELVLREEVPDLLRGPADLEDEPRGRLVRCPHGLAGPTRQRRQHGQLRGPLQGDVVAEELRVDDAGVADPVRVRLAERQEAGQVRHSYGGLWRSSAVGCGLQAYANSSKCVTDKFHVYHSS
jgi:hypothetical protein